MSRKNARLAAMVCGLMAAIGAPASASAECHPDARELQATYQPVAHSADATAVQARLTLANASRRCALPASGWKLYFTFVRQPLAAGPDGDVADAARAQLAGQGLTLAHGDAAQSGDLYVLTPTSDFQPVAPGTRRAIDFGVELWTILKTDAPAGFHVVFDGEPARWVPARALLDRTDPAQTTAFSGDANPVPTAASRFAENTSPLLALGLRDRIVPRPARARALPGVVAVGGGRTTIAAPSALRGEAGYLQAALGDVLRGGADVVDHARQPDIALALDPRLGAEAYTLDARDGRGGGIRIAGGDAAGVLYGIQTLRQLIPVDAYRAAASGRRVGTFWMPGASVSDQPLLGYRGLQIDVARHFQSPASLKKLIDLMAFLKLNRLHLHLTDDEGWRLQIPGLPELTDFGAHRGYDVAEEHQLHQGMGSGSDLSSDDGVQGKAHDATEANLGRAPAYQGFEQATLNYVGQGSGFLTTGDFEDLLKYAGARHIAVIPEFDMPAHARAAVQAMEHRGDAQYRLADPDDTSSHRSVQGYTDNLVNPCLDSTYAFLTKVVHEVRAMYDAAGVPLTMVNLGGDEAPGPDRWQHSPACAANPETAGKDDKQLIDLFYTKWNAIALQVAPKTAGWEDILLEGSGSLKLDNFVPLPWQNVWGWGREQVAYKLANAGTPVVLAHSTNLYMDLAYNKDPDEPGYYWASLVDDKSTFTYQPFDVYANATNDRWGNPFTPDPSWEKLTDAGKKNIMGLEAQLWGENAKSPQIREYQAFPKLLGAATRAWDQDTPAPQDMPKAWDTFVNTVGQVTFPLLSFYQAVGDERDGGTGVNYRIPLPGGKVENGRLTANVRNPGLAIEWSTDGRSWRGYHGPARVGDGPVVLRARAVDGRTSRPSPIGVPAWSADAAYPSGSVVTSAGDTYRATHAAPAGGPAPVDATDGTWTAL
ncbi:N,N'-diacetylchitobiase [Baekduia alba]|uniref:family 20 glycosylhydrolase n=1 Tax=Baekduia alba TaxID=2997333 RepID=UPI00234125F5|nr:family 20 glycosylhydrolase [Baekduia alba]WCB96178.1 N,N'-diacetylchitobiase [Baekduia alba]